MKKTACFLVVFAMCVAESVAAPSRTSVQTPGGSRHSVVSQYGGKVSTASRLATLPMHKNLGELDNVTNASDSDKEQEDEQEQRDKARTACTSNNIGMSNTFVWAARDSNIENYSSMIEDAENPDNNVCFVRVELKSNDARVNISDMNGRYFEMGKIVKCGGWVDEAKLEQRILDAKKTVRTLATVGGGVGGAAVGVGTMELVGNKLLAKAGVESVQGQKALQGDDLLKSSLLVLKKDNTDEYNRLVNNLKIIKEECEKEAGSRPYECERYDYESVLNSLDN